MGTQVVLQILADKFWRFAPQAATGILVFLAFWIAAVLVRRLVDGMGRLRGIDTELVRFLATSAKTTLVILGAITGLGTAGVNVAALVAGLGLTGFALGFALKDVISSAVAGILLIIYKPVRHNDRITVGAFQGTVVAIDLRYTVLKTEEKTIYLPNSTLFTNGITVQRADAEAESSGED